MGVFRGRRRRLDNARDGGVTASRAVIADGVEYRLFYIDPAGVAAYHRLPGEPEDAQEFVFVGVGCKPCVPDPKHLLSQATHYGVRRTQLYDGDGTVAEVAAARRKSDRCWRAYEAVRDGTAVLPAHIAACGGAGAVTAARQRRLL